MSFESSHRPQTAKTCICAKSELPLISERVPKSVQNHTSCITSAQKSASLRTFVALFPELAVVLLFWALWLELKCTILSQDAQSYRLRMLALSGPSFPNLSSIAHLSFSVPPTMLLAIRTFLNEVCSEHIKAQFPFVLLLSERQKGVENLREGKTYHRTLSQKRF